jgi:hypothetical protein
MGRVYVFADEAGNFDFPRASGATRYFILGTITTSDASAGEALLDLRRELAWEGVGLATLTASDTATAWSSITWRYGTGRRPGRST